MKLSISLYLGYRLDRVPRCPGRHPLLREAAGGLRKTAGHLDASARITGSIGRQSHTPGKFNERRAHPDTGLSGRPTASVLDACD